MSSLISEMKRYLITPEILFEKANALTDNKTLKNKLIALSNVLRNIFLTLKKVAVPIARTTFFILPTVSKTAPNLTKTLIYG